MSLILPRLISCDEAGFTGNNLLDADQRYFGYASHDLSLDDSEALLAEARAKFPVQMPELKAHKLLKTVRGQALLEYVADRMEGRYITTIYDKRLALCCKVFEYIYEPVLQENNALFYRNGLHRYVAMFLYMHLLAEPATMGALAAEFEAFMRTLDLAQAPTLLGSGPDDEEGNPLAMIRRFARGFNLKIAQETRDLRETSDQGRWILDLSFTALFSHLVAWGQRHPLLSVICDDSKPLQAAAAHLGVMINRHDHPMLDFWGKPRGMTWNMSGPIAFGSSLSHAGIQLADLMAGCAAAAPSAQEDEAIRPLAARISMHMNDECILPDMDIIDLNTDDAAVNFFILEGLAQRADNGDDPLYLMEMMYETGRATLPLFRAGQFR